MYVTDFGNVNLMVSHQGPSFYADMNGPELYETLCSAYQMSPSDLAWHYTQCHHLKQNPPFVSPDLDDVLIALKMRSLDKNNRNDGAMGYVSHKSIVSVRETSKSVCRIRMASGYEFEALASERQIDKQRWRGDSFSWQLRGLNWASRPDFLAHHSLYRRKANS